MAEMKAREELQVYCRREMDAADFVSSDISWLLGIRSEQDMCTIDLGTSSRIQERVRDAVLDVSQSLLRNANASINCATKHPLSRTERESIPPPTTGNAKKKQNSEANKLLWHMTKGTQSLEMFDKLSVWGYTRQKFVKRALLLSASFLKLHPGSVSSIDGDCGLTPAHRQIQRMAWASLKVVNRVCSIGCGPGNDVLGFLVMQKCLNDGARGALSNLKLNLFDYAMGIWQDAVLDELLPILVDRGLIVTLDGIYCGKCDVTMPLEHGGSSVGEQGKINSVLSAITRTSCGASTLYITSYLLTETRGRWESFYDQLISGSKPRDLFYFCEPTPWQLFHLIQVAGSRCYYLWLDSSMYHPELQDLHGRSGPAVLLAIRK